MTKVKICGITTLEDALMVVGLGADMIGLNFFEGSKRYISPEESEALVYGLSMPVLKVGIFVNATIDDILLTRTLGSLDAVQLHGDESREFISELRAYVDTYIIKAVRIRPDHIVEELNNLGADALLLDTMTDTGYGGTGETFDWTIGTEVTRFSSDLYLAGGLSPENVAEAVNFVRPYAVDVASGVESSPGKKCPKKVEAFIKNAKNA